MGFALIYLPHMPDAFGQLAGAPTGSDLVNSLYIWWAAE